MDITDTFKSTLKSCRKKKAAQGEKLKPDDSILGRSKRSTEFTVKAKDVTQYITKLRDFLLENRKDYVNAAGHLGDAVCSMTDADRDQIDSEAEKIMKFCSESIRNIKAEGFEQMGSTQLKEHRNTVFLLLEQYLKEVCQIYSTQRAIRVKRVVDRKRISRLEPEQRPAPRSFVGELEAKAAGGAEPGRDGQPGQVEEPPRGERGEPGPPRAAPLDVLFGEEDADSDISPEEAQMLAAENEQLFEEMNSLVDEVKQIEGKVVEISKLQEIFADKVLEQTGDIERVGECVVGSTENIKEANEEIREAMKNNAGLRVWILFFLIVCSLSLLFLDWYNP